MSPRLGQHLPEPFVEVHPDDAARFGVTDGDFARVTTDYGQCTLRVVVSERQQRGMLFAPIHWSEANATGARVGALVAPITDPFSGQPENKATPASIVPYEYVFRGFALSRRPLALPAHAWWRACRRRWRLWLSVRRQCGSGGLAILAEIDRRATISPSTGILAAAYTARRRLPAIASRPACSSVRRGMPATGMSSRGLFAADALSDDQRRMLLSGKSIDGLANAGPIVCACFGVGRNTICDAIAGGAQSAAEIGARLKAGTNCGSCIPEMKRLIAQTAPGMRRAAQAGGGELRQSLNIIARRCGADASLLRASQ